MSAILVGSGGRCEAKICACVFPQVPDTKIWLTIPAARIEKQKPALLLQAFCTLIHVGWNHGCRVSARRSGIW
jgi:hypothetical protein